MLGALPVSNVQIAPVVEPAPAAVQKAVPVPSIGMLPTTIVPASISSPRVADDQRSAGQTTQQTRSVPVAADTANIISAFSNAASGQIVLPSPYSTTFLAQLFGQLPTGQMDGIVSSLMDFDYIAEVSMVKYQPSLAFRPQASEPVRSAPANNNTRSAAVTAPTTSEASAVTPEADTDIELQETPASTVPFSLGADSGSAETFPVTSTYTAANSNSSFTRVSEAYASTQTRNQQETEPKSTGNAVSIVF